jgi:hypothetical protein
LSIINFFFNRSIKPLSEARIAYIACSFAAFKILTGYKPYLNNKALSGIPLYVFMLSLSLMKKKNRIIHYHGYTAPFH